METTQYTYEDVIGYAVLIEQRGIKLYTDAAKGLKNEPARNILLHLAEQERQHEQYFLQLKDEAKAHDSRKVDMDDQSVGYLAALAKSEIFADDGKPYDQKFKTLQDVIEFGMQAEKDSILFYVELARLGWEETTRSILQSIIKEEKKHLVQLVELRQLIEERDVYY
jgi:rubrerythrin